MATNTTTIAKQLYVTVQYRGDTNNEDGLLGFASPYTKDEAFRKRKHTQDSWAYGNGSVTIDPETDDITVTGGSQRGGYGGGGSWDASMLFIANCYPRIIANEPVEGFEIAKSVRRYGWNGGGNVKWRITDPRGFDLEISSENFASVLACSTMVNGIIQGKCVWGRMGKDNVLLPEASAPYQEAVSHTTKMNKKISLKDIKPGDTVELFNRDVSKEQAVCEYLGKMYFLCSTGTTRGYTLDGYKLTSQSEGYLFRSKSDDEYFTVKTPKVIDIVDQCATARDREEIAKEATAYLAGNASSKVDNIYNCFLISETKIKTDCVTVALEAITGHIDTTNWPIVDSYYPHNIVCKDGDKFFLAERKHDGNRVGVELSPITIVDNQVKFEMTKVNDSNNYWYRQHGDRYDKVRVDTDPSPMGKFYLTVTANGMTGKVFKL